MRWLEDEPIPNTADNGSVMTRTWVALSPVGYGEDELVVHFDTVVYPGWVRRSNR